ncbi:hypothetical protein ILYODFUR_039142 [Ilyodon furcidens]|uniref:Uncharacterized protein n=1 Tax=Ilyodon furcidens TaxID=33524 RepID=A0ABV0TUR9_9TELE
MCKEKEKQNIYISAFIFNFVRIGPPYLWEDAPMCLTWQQEWCQYVHDLCDLGQQNPRTAMNAGRCSLISPSLQSMMAQQDVLIFNVFSDPFLLISYRGLKTLRMIKDVH